MIGHAVASRSRSETNLARNLLILHLIQSTKKT
jgi:hypothetical protein